MSAALWLRNFDIEPIILEKEEYLGGSLQKSPYKNIWLLGQYGETGETLAKKFIHHLDLEHIAAITKTEIKTISKGKAKSFSIKTATDKSFEADSIIIASGAHFSGKEILLSISGFTSVEKYFYFGPGSWRSSSLFINKKVIILGGGDNAYDSAMFLCKLASNINIVMRGIPRAQKRLTDSIEKFVKAGIVSIHENSKILSFENDKDKVITKIKNNEKGTNLESDNVIVTYGYKPNTNGILKTFKDISLPKLDSNGHLMVDKNCRTNVKFIYAVGESCDLGNPCVVTSIAHGTIAARSIKDDLE